LKKLGIFSELVREKRSFS